MGRWIAIGALLALSASCSTTASPQLAYTGLLDYGSPVEQTLSGPNQEHHWSFVGSAGDTIDIVLQTQDIHPTLILRDAAGHTIGEVPGGSYQDIALLPGVNLPASGTYLIVIAASDSGSGLYRLTLDRLPSPTPTYGPIAFATPTPGTASASQTPTPTLPLATAFATAPPTPTAAPGLQLQPYQSVAGSLDQTGEIDRYTIFGQAGDVIAVGMTAAPGSAVDPYIVVYNPAGEVLVEVDNTFDTTNAVITGITLPVTGAYIVFARDASGGATGAYHISFGSGSIMRESLQTPTVAETVYTGTISQPAVRDVWPLDLVLGDVISAAVVVDDSSSLDPVLSLISPDGQTLYRDDNSGGGRSAALRQIIAPQTGRFLLAVSPVEVSALGPYTLIWRYEAQAPTPAS